MEKKGISFVILIVTIVLLVILLGITTAMVGNSIQNSRRSAFASDLASLQDAVNVYYIQNAEFPIVSEGNKYIEYVYDNGNIKQKNGGTNFVTINNKAKFEEEMKTNVDLSDGQNVVTDNVFYKIDLKKISVEKIKRGTGTNGADDIYMMAYPSQTIYYLKGLNVDDEIYYSLAKLSKLQNIQTKVENATGEATISKTSSGITVKRENKEWTNTLDIVIDAYLESNETLWVKIPQSSTSFVEKQLSTTSAQNIIKLVSLKGSLELTDDKVNTFNNLDKSLKKLIIVKKQGTAEVGSITVDISNYENEIPQFPASITIDSNADHNLVKFTGVDKVSGIREVRYLVVKKYNSNGDLEAVYKNENGAEIKSFTPEYMLKNGEKAYVTDNKVDIKLDKDVKTIFMTMFDKAGNSISELKNTQPNIYVGMELKNVTSNLEVEYFITSNSAITAAETAISSDNTTYTSVKNISLTSPSTYKYKASTTFTKPDSNEVYIRAIITDVNGNKETRIKKMDLAKKVYELTNSVVPGITYSSNRTYVDKNNDEAVLPAGFKVSTKADEQTIQNGLVIIDGNGNEFVWVPCTIDGEGGSIKYAKNFSYPSNYEATTANTADDTDALPIDLKGNLISETEQIVSYKGFYVGRYEAGVPANQTTIDGNSNSTSDVEGIPVVKKGITGWTNISYDKVVHNAKKLYASSNSVRSGILTGTQWDTMCAWLSSGSSAVNVTNSTSWGNYTDDSVDGNSGKKSTGSQEQWKAKNIYDVAGNLWEWSGEKRIDSGYTSKRINRSGGYTSSGSYAASYRYDDPSYNGFYNTSFRIVLYVL